MAINTTRGLPSFSEMYAAYKNRGGLADAINAGVSGFEQGTEIARKGIETRAEADLKKAQAQKALSDANKDPYKDYIPVDSIAPLVDETQFEAIKLGAVDVGGTLKIPRSAMTTITPLVREQGSERRAELGREAAETAQRRLLDDMSKRQSESERAADERQAEAQRQQALMAVAGEKLPQPSLAERGFSAVKTTLGGKPTSKVAALEEQLAAKQAMKQKAGLSNPPNELDKATGIMPTPSFANEAELDAAIQAGQVKPGDKVMVGGVSGTAR